MGRDESRRHMYYNKKKGENSEIGTITDMISPSQMSYIPGTRSPDFPDLQENRSMNIFPAKTLPKSNSKSSVGIFKTNKISNTKVFRASPSQKVLNKEYDNSDYQE